MFEIEKPENKILPPAVNVLSIVANKQVGSIIVLASINWWFFIYLINIGRRIGTILGDSIFSLYRVVDKEM